MSEKIELIGDNGVKEKFNVWEAIVSAVCCAVSVALIVLVGFALNS